MIGLLALGGINDDWSGTWGKAAPVVPDALRRQAPAGVEGVRALPQSAQRYLC